MPQDTFIYDKVEVFIFVGARRFLYLGVVKVVAAPVLLSAQFCQSKWHAG